MASVSVVWTGNCRDPRTRYRLLGYLHRLASQSDGFLRRRPPERPPFLTLVDAQGAGIPRPRPNIDLIDQKASGTILVSSLVGAAPELLAASARSAGVMLIENPKAPNGAPMALAKARLRGLDFKLFDPRGLYPSADRMSFVFLECAEHPVLDGSLVQIADPADIAAEHAQGARDAGLHLCAPSVHLHDYLEDWTDCLFSWIKFFFIGDLSWHRREPMQGYADYRHVFEDLQIDRGTERAEEAAFDAVLATFAQHAEHWLGEVSGRAKAERG